MSEPVELIDKVEFLRSTQNMQNNPTTIVEQQPQHQEEPVSKQQEKKIEQVHQIDKKFSSLCKFGIQCEEIDTCEYVHPGEQYYAQKIQDFKMCKPQECKYGENCPNLDECRFLHPKELEIIKQKQMFANQQINNFNKLISEFTKQFFNENVTMSEKYQVEMTGNLNQQQELQNILKPIGKKLLRTSNNNNTSNNS
eukprot:TRINITY_DN15661_c0_g1_i2.p2 TRINITY_DN15661_c0_g1~~TRINITY_DN15661_c0_g1_i2.p2  ORF type:complete len:196 (-),score=50.94 TRINITY_DN15661_c0_g1_i2:250-837(-)